MSKDSEISSIENKVKMSLLQAEKRLVELEMGITELKELKGRLGDFDPSQLQQVSGVDELKQRVDDLEDLIMIENVGIEELKKMMAASQQPSTEQQKVEEPAEPQQQELPQEFHEKMAAVEQLQGKVENIEEIEQQIQTIVSEVSSLRNDLTMMKTTAPGVKLGPEFQLMSTKIDNLKNIVDDLLTRKVELDMKLEGVEKTLAFLQSSGVGRISDDARRDLDTIRRDYSVTSSRLDSLENVAHDFSEDMIKIESSLGKFESFERASALGKEIESKLEEFKFVEGEIRRVSNRIESVYDSIDKRLDKIKNVEKKFPELLESIESTNKELDKVRVIALERARKDDIDKLEKKMEDKITNLETEMERKVPDINTTVSGLSKKIDESKIMILERAKRDELENLYKKFNDVEKKFESIKIGDIEKHFSKVDRLLDEKISEVQSPISILSVQISELLGRIVMLESRLGNMEVIVRDRGTQPIIIE